MHIDGVAVHRRILGVYAEDVEQLTPDADLVRMK
jgi:hypothetical protein